MFATATEKVTVFPATYNIKFIGGIERKPVTITNAIDTSPFPERYNEFSIPSDLFMDMDSGFYTYEITDDEENVLEVGKMKLVGPAQLSIQYKDAPTEYTTYGK